MSWWLSIFPATLSLASRALALVLSIPRSTLSPTVSPLASALSFARSALSSALSPVLFALPVTLSLASVLFSFVLSQASEVFSLVLSHASDVFSFTVSLASVAFSLTVLLSSAAMAGRVLHASPSAMASAVMVSLRMACPPHPSLAAKPTPADEGTSGLQDLLGNLFHIGGVDLTLVRLHHVADDAADLLGIGDAERLGALLHEIAQRG